MPKMKTNRGAAKRFSVTGSGKIKHKKPNARHIMNSKNRARKRRLRKPAIGSGVDEGRVKRLLGMG